MRAAFTAAVLLACATLATIIATTPATVGAAVPLLVRVS